jgi:hypothetical protein
MDLTIEQMSIISTIACTFLSMIITIIGWGVTFSIQKRILEMQTLAEFHRQQAQFQEERVKQTRQAMSSLRMEQLNIVKD